MYVNVFAILTVCGSKLDGIENATNYQLHIMIPES